MAEDAAAYQRLHRYKRRLTLKGCDQSSACVAFGDAVYLTGSLNVAFLAIHLPLS